MAACSQSEHQPSFLQGKTTKQFILVLLFIYHCIIYYYEPTFAHLCIELVDGGGKLPLSERSGKISLRELCRMAALWPSLETICFTVVFIYNWRIKLAWLLFQNSHDTYSRILPEPFNTYKSTQSEKEMFSLEVNISEVVSIRTLWLVDEGDVV